MTLDKQSLSARLQLTNRPILIAGLGSIDRRHLRNLRALGHKKFVLYRTGKSTLPDDEIKPTIEQSLFDGNFKQGILDAQQGPLKEEYRFYGKTTSTDRVLLWLRYFEKTVNTFRKDL